MTISWTSLRPIRITTACNWLVRESVYSGVALIVRTARRCGDWVRVSTRARRHPRESQGGELLIHCILYTHVEPSHKLNILVDSECHARLAGFGLSVVMGESTTWSVNDQNRIIHARARWTPPEVMHPMHFGFTGEDNRRLSSWSTDIYALGMTILEVSPFTSLLLSKDILNSCVGSHGAWSVRQHR